MKILVDTDIGSDLDDALALSLLLARSDVSILGITTVSGLPEVRAQLASVLCRFFEKDVPIVAGARTPLFGPQRQGDVPQAEILSRWPHDDPDRSRPAEDFLAEVIDRNPGVVTLLAIGPLTNVARLVDRHPQSIARLKSLVTMSGRFATGVQFSAVPEWNVLCDTVAARSVYSLAGTVELLHVSSDVTRRLVLPAAEALRRFDRPALAPVREMAGIWFAGRGKVTFHDPLAAAVLLEPNLCSYKNGVVNLDIATGVTRWTDDADAPTRVTRDVSAAAFFDFYFGQT